MTTKPKLKPPPDAPCWNCVQAIGTSVCKTTCGYWDELLKLAKTGVLEKVEDWKKVTTNVSEISKILKEGDKQ